MYEPKPPANPCGTAVSSVDFPNVTPFSSDISADDAITPAVISPAAEAIDAANRDACDRDIDRPYTAARVPIIAASIAVPPSTSATATGVGTTPTPFSR